MQVKVTMKWPNRQMTSIYNETEYYCPNCGEKSVFNEDGDGDYYLGVQFLCVSCDHTFYLPSGCRVDDRLSHDVPVKK